MSVVIQLYFQIVEENNYMFRPFSGWAIIRLRLEYLRKPIYYKVYILDVHIVVYEFSPIFLSQPNDGPPREGPKHVVDLFNNLKIVMLRRTFIHLISASITSHNGDDAEWLRQRATVDLPSSRSAVYKHILRRCGALTGCGVATQMIRECVSRGKFCSRMVLFYPTRAVTSFCRTSLYSCDTYSQTYSSFNSVLFASSLGKLLLASSILLDALSALNKSTLAGGFLMKSRIGDVLRVLALRLPN
jgi:hypothetical protein